MSIWGLNSCPMRGYPWGFIIVMEFHVHRVIRRIQSPLLELKTKGSCEFFLLFPNILFLKIKCFFSNKLRIFFYKNALNCFFHKNIKISFQGIIFVSQGCFRAIPSYLPFTSFSKSTYQQSYPRGDYIISKKKKTSKFIFCFFYLSFIYSITWI
jgi:hypothetical protein